MEDKYLNKPRKGGVLDRVKETFQKMTFGEVDPSSLHHLAMMNVPAMMARRDAAYARVVHLLREHLFGFTEKNRCQIYDGVLELLDVAIDITDTIIPVSKSQKKDQPNAILQYLVLLKDTVNAAAGLVRHEIILYKEEHDLSNFIGSEIANQFQSADEVFSDSEMNIFRCISELVEIAEPAMNRARENRKRSFSKNDLDRYNKALEEFQGLYNQSGEISSESE